MYDIYRIFQYRAGSLEEIAFVAGLESTRKYLQTCYEVSNFNPDQFYFAVRIKIEL